MVGFWGSRRDEGFGAWVWVRNRGGSWQRDLRGVKMLGLCSEGGGLQRGLNEVGLTGFRVVLLGVRLLRIHVQERLNVGRTQLGSGFQPSRVVSLVRREPEAAAVNGEKVRRERSRS